jgi:membrane protein DedA with SNARE-associated domain
MLHEWLKAWFDLVESWGYLGVFLLMAMESSIFPVPSEIVMPPAAFWATQGKMNFWGVVFAGTAGSYFGSIVTYYVAQWVGLPFVQRFGKFFFLSPDKLKMAESWIRQYGKIGIFFARLLPVIRHLISIPAGLLRMNVRDFSLLTIVGAFLWCLILSIFGAKVIGEHPELLASPEQMIGALKAQLHWFVLGALVLGVLVVLVKIKSASFNTKRS